MTELSADRVEDILAQQFPDLQAIDVRYLGEGCDSTAFTVDDRWVFRFPKRRDVEEQLALEMRVLPVLARDSPLPLPVYRYQGHPSPDFPRRFGGYPKLHGRPCLGVTTLLNALPQWSPSLGRFLSWLHGFPLSTVKELGVPDQPADFLDDLRAEALDDFDRIDRVNAGLLKSRWRGYLRDRFPVGSPSASLFVHSDLAAEHVLCDPSLPVLTGVIDWSDMAVGDPAVDIAGVFHWGGPALVDAVLAHYDAGVDERLLRRARFIAVCRGIMDVAFGLESDRAAYVSAGLNALTLCADE